jgi:hypothetical protein
VCGGPDTTIAETDDLLRAAIDERMENASGHVLARRVLAAMDGRVHPRYPAVLAFDDAARTDLDPSAPRAFFRVCITALRWVKWTGIPYRQLVRTAPNPFWALVSKWSSRCYGSEKVFRKLPTKRVRSA